MEKWNSTFKAKINIFFNAFFVMIQIGVAKYFDRQFALFCCLYYAFLCSHPLLRFLKLLTSSRVVRQMPPTPKILDRKLIKEQFFQYKAESNLTQMQGKGKFPFSAHTFACVCP